MFTRIVAGFVLIVSLLGAMLGSVRAEVNPGLTASFFNPAQEGHGINVEMLENGLLVVYWYTFRPDGTSLSLYGVLSPDGDGYSGELRITSGMIFGEFDPADFDEEVWGTLTLVFTDCNNGTMTWTSTQPGYTNGSIPLQRITSVAGANCVDSPFHGNFVLELVSAEGLGRGRAIALADGTFAYALVNQAEFEVGVGQWEQLGDSTLMFDAQGFVDANEPVTLSGQAELDADGFNGATNDGTLLAAIAQRSFQNNLKLSSLAGQYAVSNGADLEEVGQLTIAANGAVTGMLSGFVLDGTLSVPDNNFNQIKLEIDFSGIENGTFIGAGVTTNEDITLIVVDPTQGGLLLLLDRL